MTEMTNGNDDGNDERATSAEVAASLRSAEMKASGTRNSVVFGTPSSTFALIDREAAGKENNRESEIRDDIQASMRYRLLVLSQKQTNKYSINNYDCGTFSPYFSQYYNKRIQILCLEDQINIILSLKR